MQNDADPRNHGIPRDGTTVNVDGRHDRFAAGDQTVGSILAPLVTMAQSTMAGIDGASVTLVRTGAFKTTTFERARVNYGGSLRAQQGLHGSALPPQNCAQIQRQGAPYRCRLKDDNARDYVTTSDEFALVESVDQSTAGRAVEQGTQFGVPPLVARCYSTTAPNGRGVSVMW